MSTTATPFLMFQGKAQDAIDLYIATLPGTRVMHLQRHAARHRRQRDAGAYRHLRSRVSGIGQPAEAHAFDFTPSSSIFIECASADEQDRLFAGLGDGDRIMMPLNNYGLGRRFGVSWQINLAQ